MSSGDILLLQHNYKWRNALLTAAVLVSVVAVVWYGLFVFKQTQATFSSERSGLQQVHAALLANSENVRGNWMHTLNPDVQNVQGELVWSPNEQLGSMRLVNLPSVKQDDTYQLWIYDTYRTQNEPILGATLPAKLPKGESFVTIRPAIPVTEPYKFMLTKRQPDSDEVQTLLMVQP